MQARDISGNEVSNDTFENKAEMLDKMHEAFENEKVKTIEVTKDVVLSNTISAQRKALVEKKIRKLDRKKAELVKELRSVTS